MVVYVVVCSLGCEVFTEEWKADLLYSEWDSDINQTSVRKYECEVKEC